MMDLYFNITLIFILSACIVMNSSGVLILIGITREKTNHFYILNGLMLANDIIAVIWLLRLCAYLSGYYSETFLDVTWCLKIGSVIFWFLMMYMLTIDRLIGCLFPFYHRVKMIPMKIRNTVIAAAIFGTLNAITYSFLDLTAIQQFFYQYVWLTCDGTYLLLFVITYSLIKCKMSEKKISSSVENTRRSRNQHRFNKAITKILVSYLVLEVLPTATMSVLKFTFEEVPELVINFIRLFWAINHLNDPLILIFQQKAARRFACNHLRRLFNKPPVVYTFNTDSFTSVQQRTTRNWRKAVICPFDTNEHVRHEKLYVCSAKSTRNWHKVVFHPLNTDEHVTHEEFYPMPTTNHKKLTWTSVLHVEHGWTR